MFGYGNKDKVPAWIPVVQRSWWPFSKSKPLPTLIQQGYELFNKARNVPFRMRYWGHDYVILPVKYFKDLKAANKNHEATEICIDEANDAFLRELGNCESWSSYPALDVLCEIAHNMAARILVDHELCRDPNFRKASYDYFSGHATTGFILLCIPFEAIRSILAAPLSYLQRRRQQRVLGLVSSVMRSRIDARKLDNPLYIEQIDCMDWTLKIQDDFLLSSKEDLLSLMSYELIYLLGASHAPTGMILVQMLWQLLIDKPEYLAALRDEAEAAISRYGMTAKLVNHSKTALLGRPTDSIPTISVSGLGALLITLVRYCRYLNYVIVGVTRIIIDEPFTFHNRFTLPAGTRIAFPVDAYTRDADTFSNPEVFDGSRHFRLSQSDARTEDGVNQWKASHAHQGNLAFGYGTHVCPGRFFAVRLIKIIFTKLLVEYDFRSEWQKGRIPPSFHIEGSSIPHNSARIALKRRSGISHAVSKDHE